MKSGFVAIIGRPNAGKSTLLNSILGSKVSIVTPKAQTTRERVLGILTEKKGKEVGQIVFIDTPGVHRAKVGGINEFMMSEARESLDGPALIWYIVDPASAAKHEEEVLKLLDGIKAPIFLLMNKSDVVRGDTKKAAELFLEELAEAMKTRGIAAKASFFISARKGRELDPLMKATWKEMPEGPLYYPDEEQVSDRPLRFFAAEKIREQLLLKLGDEVPYSCAVEIEKYSEPKKKDDITRIEAMIHVERDSQKGMVIGKGGQKIKEIGQAARLEIEEFIGSKVFLGLRVKVLKDWSKNAQALKQLGYALPPERGKK
jgi:GTP-binding protein Era